ncbi:helix-turn-helix domain-containing protein [Paenibacillus sp. GYB003]|uniref:helix-turn-helix domain-containing protein n=1 Tax=Paenibacillus sp. GYB003 TaxID=2994392 RepID=UPI002F96D7D1
MGKFRPNSRLFYQYIGSYIVMLMLPVLVIGFVAYSYFIKLMKDEVIRSNLTVLSQVKDTIDTKMNELGNIAVHIAANPQLSPYTATKNAFNEMNASAELRNYASANSFIHDMLLYFRGRSYLYSPYSVYAAQTYPDKIFRYESWSSADFYRDINKLETPLLRPAEIVSAPNPEPFITYIVPIPYRETSPYGTVLFQIRAKTINDMIVTTFGDYGGNAIILNERDEPITSLAPVSSPSLGRLLDTVRAQGESGSGTVLFDGEEYFAGYVKSAATGWTYISLVNKSTVMKSVELVKTRTAYSLILVLLLGTAAIFGVMSLNYSPIRRLKQLAESMLDRAPRHADELESIRSAFRYMSESNDELHRKLDSSKPALKSYLMSGLLKGQFSDIRSFNDKGEAADLRFTKRLFRVAIFAFSRKDDLRGSTGASVVEDIERLLAVGHASPETGARQTPSRFEGYGLDSLDGSKLVFIIGVDNADERALGEKLAHLRLHVARTRGLNATIGVGNPYAGADEIGKSYIEATGAVDYRLIKGHGEIIFFGEAVARADVPQSGYPSGDRNRLKLYMVQGDTEQIETQLDAIIATIKGDGVPLFTAKCICFDLINVIFSIMYDMNIRPDDRHKRYPDVLSLTEFETVDELVELVRTISADICSIVRGQKESANFRLRDQIVDYIERHYASSQFSVQALADDLSMSPSYLSRYFKDQTGQTIMQYVNSVRMEKAKRLLLEGTDSMQHVVGQIGFGSVPGFIRKFKEIEGMTPGEFRSLHQKNV